MIILFKLCYELKNLIKADPSTTEEAPPLRGPPAGWARGLQLEEFKTSRFLEVVFFEV